MEKLIKIIRISSKEWFKELKSKSPIFCNSLEKNIYITHTFYNHIAWYKKTRPIREIIERLILINLIVKIIKNWKLVEKRKNQIIEKNLFFIETYKIVLNINKINFKIIIWKKKNWDLILISCFIWKYK